MKISIDFKRTARIAGILLIGLFLGWLFFGGTAADQSTTMDEHISEAHTNEQGEIVYTCSMHPSVEQSEPGNCPICGMELIPKNQGSNGSSEDNPYQVTMTDAASKLADIQTTPVVKEVASKRIRMPGKVTVDERRISNVTAHFPGRITNLYVDFTGARIDEDQRLASVYSPQLLSAQRELIETRKHKQSNLALYEATRRKLELWELPENEIQKIENSGEVIREIDIVSPAEGYVLERNISLQDHVIEGTVMYKIANLSSVWVTFDAYESDIANVEVGDQVSFSVESYPGETFEAEVTYIDPTLDSQSHTATVRAEAENSNRRLKPEMLAEGIISSEVEGGREQLLVPKSAVLWTGERSVVYVKQPNASQPTFEFREIVLGQRVGDQYVVKSGVQAGEKVVTHGNFKIDSAAQLAGKASMMNQNPDGSKPAGHDHGSMEMEEETSKPDTTEESHQHTEHLDTLVESYLNMKSALAEDHFEEAKGHLKTFRAEVTQSAEMNNHPEHSAMHQQHHAAMVQAVDTGIQSKNIQELRATFADISKNLVMALENQGYDGKELFLQYCPMAENQKGANWISESMEISNPYMGQKMATCGSTEKTITPEL
jgi:Cu(I)/Ag(I) efflux system membrane fusion protein